MCVCVYDFDLFFSNYLRLKLKLIAMLISDYNSIRETC